MIVAIAIRLLLLAMLCADDGTASVPFVHTINLVADRNSTFHLVGNDTSEMDLVAGEPVLLHVEARKAKSMNRDGSVHGFVLLNRGRKSVPGWDLLFKPGVQEMQLTAPAEPGVYEAVCTVICSADHEHMKLRVVVRPK
ncbi:MAG TPA: hypothetical protein VG498_02160 [Terriglobales bacterium]|nr:hypothetical protein [Terriglobales bacterium]